MAYNKVKIVYTYTSSGYPIPGNEVAAIQPGDQTIQDIYQNIFDNWNKEPGSYGLAGVTTASDGTRTALQPATLNTGVLVARDVDNAAVSPQPLYENLNYTRYRITYTYGSNGFPIPGNEVDPDPFKADAFDYVFTAIGYTYNSAGYPVPGPVAGRVPQPYSPTKIQYVENPGGSSLPAVPTNVLQSVVVAGETVLLTLDISNDPDSPYLTLEDDIHSLGILVPVS